MKNKGHFKCSNKQKMLQFSAEDSLTLFYFALVKLLNNLFNSYLALSRATLILCVEIFLIKRFVYLKDVFIIFIHYAKREGSCLPIYSAIIFFHYQNG